MQLENRMIGASGEEGQPPFSRECSENGDCPFQPTRSMTDCSSPSPFTTGGQAVVRRERDVDQRDVTVEYTLAADPTTRLRGGLSVAGGGAALWGWRARGGVGAW